MWAGVIRLGLPSTVSKPTFISGIERSARTRAKPIRWVKETLPPRARARWLLMTVRLSHSSFTGHRADRGRGRHGERGVHVGDGARGGAAQDGVLGLVAGRRALGGRGVLGHRVRWCPWPARRPWPRGAAWRPGAGSASGSTSDDWAPPSAWTRAWPRLGASARAWSSTRLGLGFDGCGSVFGSLWSRPVDSPSARRRSATRCPEKYAAHVGSTLLGSCLVAVVHLLDQPLVGAELLGDRWGGARCAGGWVA